jgi:chemotaxis response regulator CheB
LLVGNNPIEMNIVFDALSSMKDKIRKIETSFSEEDTLQKIQLMRPDCLLLDDNIGIMPLKLLVGKINALRKDALSITLLKTHNKQEVTSGVHEYLMKEGLSSERIYQGLRNALKFNKTQQYLKLKYYSGKKTVKRIFI